MTKRNEGGVRANEESGVERLVRLTLTEAEYRTMMTALHNYGLYCLGASADLAQVGIKFRDGVDPLEGSRMAKLCGDRAFALKGKLKEQWEA